MCFSVCVVIVSSFGNAHEQLHSECPCPTQTKRPAECRLCAAWTKCSASAEECVEVHFQKCSKTSQEDCSVGM